MNDLCVSLISGFSSLLFSHWIGALVVMLKVNNLLNFVLPYLLSCPSGFLSKF